MAAPRRQDGHYSDKMFWGGNEDNGGPLPDGIVEPGGCVANLSHARGHKWSDGRLIFPDRGSRNATGSESVQQLEKQYEYGVIQSSRNYASIHL